MGCGRVGIVSAQLALVRIGHEVAVVDRESTSFRRSGTDFPGTILLGMGFDRDVLVKAGIEAADAFAACPPATTRTSSPHASPARRSGWNGSSRASTTRSRAAVFERLGIPTHRDRPWTTDRLLQSLLQDTETTKCVTPPGSLALVHLELHEDWYGHTVAQLEAETHTRVAFLIRFSAGVCVDSAPSCRTGTSCTSRRWRARWVRRRRWPPRRRRRTNSTRSGMPDPERPQFVDASRGGLR